MKRTRGIVIRNTTDASQAFNLNPWMKDRKPPRSRPGDSMKNLFLKLFGSDRSSKCHNVSLRVCSEEVLNYHQSFSKSSYCRSRKYLFLLLIPICMIIYFLTRPGQKRSKGQQSVLCPQ